MNAEWWSWSSFFLGVIVALLPSALAFAWFAWRAPVMDEQGRRLSDEDVKAKKPPQVTPHGTN
jgi:hypothetical protein